MRIAGEKFPQLLAAPGAMYGDMFFQGWQGLFRVIIVGALVVLLRFSGERTLSKLNAFDLVVTVALGSTLATVLLSKDVALAEGVVAFALLAGLQFAVAFFSVRWPRFGDFVKSEPALLLLHGRFLEGAMRRERMTEGEVRAAIRSQGILALEEVEAVVLETDGSVSVMRRPTEDPASALQDVRDFPSGA